MENKNLKQGESILKFSPQYSRAAFKKMSLNATPLLESSTHSWVSYIYIYIYIVYQHISQVAALSEQCLFPIAP